MRRDDDDLADDDHVPDDYDVARDDDDDYAWNDYEALYDDGSGGDSSARDDDRGASYARAARYDGLYVGIDYADSDNDRIEGRNRSSDDDGDEYDPGEGAADHEEAGAAPEDAEGRAAYCPLVDEAPLYGVPGLDRRPTRRGNARLGDGPTEAVILSLFGGLLAAGVFVLIVALFLAR